MKFTHGRKDQGPFSYHMHWFVLLLATFATVVFGVREHDGYLDYECITGNLSSSDKLPVILLHGLTDSKETWDGIYQNIPLLTGRTVCIYDARNHGDSSWNKTFDIDDLAEELGLFMDRLNIQKASLVGHSMGGLTIMKFALNNPNRVESIFVEDMSPKDIPEDFTTMLRALFNVLLESISAIPPHADPTTAVKAVINYVTKVTGQPPPEYLFKRFPFRRCYDRWQWKANFKLFIKVLEDTDSWIGRMDGLYEGGAFFVYGTASPLRMFQSYVWWCVLFLATFLTMILGRREQAVHLAYRCLNSHSSSPYKHPVIMLHGLSDTKETWDGIYQEIPRLTGRMVCIYDARNHGDSSWNNTFNVDILAEELGCFMDFLNIRKASLVGHSMGALTVMKFALNYPSRVESIFVEDTSPSEIPEEIAAVHREFFRVLLDSISAILPHSDAKTVLKSVISYVIMVTGHPPPEYLFKKYPFRRYHGRWQWKADFEIFIRALEDPAAWMGWMDGLFKGRAFFIYGKSSHFRVANHKEFIRTLFPKAEFFGVHGASHLIHQDFPVFCRKLIKFLNGQGHHKHTRDPFFQSHGTKHFDPLQHAIDAFFRSDEITHFDPIHYAAKSFFQSGA